MGFAAQLAAFRDKTAAKLDEVTRLTVTAVAGRVITELSPVGDPTLWMRSPPASYRPGNFRGNWFYGLGAPNRSTHDGVGITTLNNAEALSSKAGGQKHYISNSVEYAQALEYGHSSQAPAGILGVMAFEMVDIAETSARKVAA